MRARVQGRECRKGLWAAIFAMFWAAWLAAAPPSAQAAGMGVSLLRNPGPASVGAKLLTNPPSAGESVCGSACTAVCPSGQTADCATYYIDTRAGWMASQARAVPGWDVNISGKDNGTLRYSYRNDAVTADDPCVLREVGTIYQGSAGHFRTRSDGTAYPAKSFGRLIGTFLARPDHTAQAQCGKAPTAYVTADFHISYPARDGSGSFITRQLLGVLVYGMSGQGLDGKASQDAVFWKGDISGTQALLLHGEATGQAYSRIAEGSMQRVTIDYRPLLMKYFAPPAGYTIDDAVVTGFDVYSSVRGGDLDFSVSDINVIGCLSAGGDASTASYEACR